MNQRVVLRAINQSQILNKSNQNHTNLVIVVMVVNSTKLMPIRLTVRMNMTPMVMCTR